MDIAEPHGLKDALHKQHWNLYWECQQCPYIWSWCLSDMESGRTVISPYLSKCPLDGPSFQWGWSLVEAHTKQLTKSYKFALPPVRIGTACFCLGINQSPPLPSGFSKMSQGDWRRKLTWIQIISFPPARIYSNSKKRPDFYLVVFVAVSFPRDGNHHVCPGRKKPGALTRDCN